MECRNSLPASTKSQTFYHAFLSVGAACVDKGTFCDSIICTTFEKCVETGEPGQIVVQKLKDAAWQDLFNELVGKYGDDRGSFGLSRQWTFGLWESE